MEETLEGSRSSNRSVVLNKMRVENVETRKFHRAELHALYRSRSLVSMIKCKIDVGRACRQIGRMI